MDKGGYGLAIIKDIPFQESCCSSMNNGQRGSEFMGYGIDDSIVNPGGFSFNLDL